MTIRHLKIFVTVAETGSMSRAAQQLYLSQPTVSQAIRELEEHYQLQLFERLSRKLFITDAGKQLLTLAHQVLGQYETLEKSMEQKSQISALRIGSSITVGTCLMPDIIRDMKKSMPQIDLYSFVSNTSEIENKLLKSELDAAIVEGNIESPDLICIPIIQDSLVLCCGSSHKFYHYNQITADQLTDQPFAFREKGSGTRKLFEQYLQDRGIHVKVCWEANCPRTILNAVLKCDALTVMSARLMKHEVTKERIKIFHNTTDEWNRWFKLVYHKNKFLTPEFYLLEQTLQRYQALELPDNQTPAFLVDRE